MMESSDNTASDFNFGATVGFSPTLQHYSSGWKNSPSASSYASPAGGGYSAPPNTIGIKFYCVAPSLGHYVDDTDFGTSYAPPPVTGGYSVSC